MVCSFSIFKFREMSDLQSQLRLCTSRQRFCGFAKDKGRETASLGRSAPRRCKLAAWSLRSPSRQAHLSSVDVRAGQVSWRYSLHIERAAEAAVNSNKLLLCAGPDHRFLEQAAGLAPALGALSGYGILRLLRASTILSSARAPSSAFVA